jgi:hypothetical protein
VEKLKEIEADPKAGTDISLKDWKQKAGNNYHSIWRENIFNRYKIVCYNRGSESSIDKIVLTGYPSYLHQMKSGISNAIARAGLEEGKGYTLMTKGA